MRASGTLDLAALYSQLRCPLLVVNAVAVEQSRLRKLWAGDGLRLVEAYREGLGHDLATLAAQRPGTEVVTVDAPHMLVRTHPELVAQHVSRFLTRHLPATARGSA